jgi:hypothetical protein
MLNRDFKEFAGLLNARSVDGLVAGGNALAATDIRVARVTSTSENWQVSLQ